MGTAKARILLVFDNEHFEGVITIGDIQRAIIKNITLNEPISRVLDKDKIYGYLSDGKSVIKEKMRKMRAEVMPILDDKGELIDIWFWNDLFKDTEYTKMPKILTKNEKKPWKKDKS